MVDHLQNNPEEVSPVKLSSDVLAITVIGSATTGKSSIIKSLRNITFNNNELMTIGAQYSMDTIEINNKPYRIRICDVAGQISFNFVRHNFMRNSMGAVMIFDLTNEASFSKVNEWIYDYLAANNFNIELPILLIGNKLDLADERKVRITDIKKFLEVTTKEMKCSPNIIDYIEVSAKTGENVKYAFDKLSKYIANV